MPGITVVLEQEGLKRCPQQLLPCPPQPGCLESFSTRQLLYYITSVHRIELLMTSNAILCILTMHAIRRFLITGSQVLIYWSLSALKMYGTKESSPCVQQYIIKPIGKDSYLAQRKIMTFQTWASTDPVYSKINQNFHFPRAYIFLD